MLLNVIVDFRHAFDTMVISSCALLVRYWKRLKRNINNQFLYDHSKYFLKSNVKIKNLVRINKKKLKLCSKRSLLNEVRKEAE